MVVLLGILKEIEHVYVPSKLFSEEKTFMLTIRTQNLIVSIKDH